MTLFTNYNKRERMFHLASIGLVRDNKGHFHTFSSGLLFFGIPVESKHLYT